MEREDALLGAPLYVDDALYVVNKPPGILAQADATGDADLVSLVKARGRDAGEADPFVGLVHRLDRPASGVTVLARTPKAARALTRQFRERTVEKRYLALVEGTLTGIGTWRDFIAKLGREPTLVAPDHPDGKPAGLRWQALAHPGTGRTLLQVQLETGRPHQIRLQCATRGHAVLGDLRHGATTEVDGATLALHHVLLRLEHPTTRRVETFTAPVPDAWDALLTPDARGAIERAMT